MVLILIQRRRRTFRTSGGGKQGPYFGLEDGSGPVSPVFPSSKPLLDSAHSTHDAGETSGDPPKLSQHTGYSYRGSEWDIPHRAVSPIRPNRREDFTMDEAQLANTLGQSSTPPSLHSFHPICKEPSRGLLERVASAFTQSKPPHVDPYTIGVSSPASHVGREQTPPPRQSTGELTPFLRVDTSTHLSSRLDPASEVPRSADPWAGEDAGAYLGYRKLNVLPTSPTETSASRRTGSDWRPDLLSQSSPWGKVLGPAHPPLTVVNGAESPTAQIKTHSAFHSTPEYGQVAPEVSSDLMPRPLPIPLLTRKHK